MRDAAIRVVGDESAGREVVSAHQSRVQAGNINRDDGVEVVSLSRLLHVRALVVILLFLAI